MEYAACAVIAPFLLSTQAITFADIGNVDIKSVFA